MLTRPLFVLQLQATAATTPHSALKHAILNSIKLSEFLKRFTADF